MAPIYEASRGCLSVLRARFAEVTVMVDLIS
jgi:hypothetical protein